MFSPTPSVSCSLNLLPSPGCSVPHPLSGVASIYFHRSLRMEFTALSISYFDSLKCYTRACSNFTVADSNALENKGTSPNLCYNTFIQSRSAYNFESVLKSHGGSVSIATGYGLDDRGFEVRVPAATTPHRPYRLWSPPQWVPGVKRTGCEAEHSPPTSAEIIKMLIYTSTPPIRLHGAVLN
jgi:hypothetical protein